MVISKYGVRVSIVFNLHTAKCHVAVDFAEAKQEAEDKIALYLQTIIAKARSRGVKPQSETQFHYGEDDFSRSLEAKPLDNVASF